MREQEGDIVRRLIRENWQHLRGRGQSKKPHRPNPATSVQGGKREKSWQIASSERTGCPPCAEENL